MTEIEKIVYISCVEEVRYSFVSHLSEALRRKGIHDVFVDSDDLLSNESQSKVERARVSVMVLPGNHTVNLDKLLKVLECQKNKDQVVVPVLYGVRSLDLEWLSALYSKGFSSVHYSRKECSDSQLVKEVVRDVYEKLFYMGRIGIYSKLLEIEKMVCKQPLDIRSIGIWGMPGIGKTTLAKAVFDQMSGEFDAYCFIEDYTKAIQEKGLYRLLEEQFLKEKAVAGGTNTKLSLLREKLNNKRVLVVLDDVYNPLAVESFLGGFDWFGPKSLIIITSRDKQVFRLCRVNQIYEVQGLNEKEALQLFSLCASIDDMAEQNLHEVSMKVIKYAIGYPLALNFYGRELKGKKRPPEMETAFLELKERPPTKFVDAIKSSYEALNDSCRNIFLDIACFFKRENVDYVMQLLEGCGFFPHVGIDILVENCLVTVSENRVCMHNLIQDVGRQIGRRSRLWEPWSIKYLLEENEHNADVEPKTTFKRVQGTEEIEGMFLDTSNLSFEIKPAAFDNMLNLRLLKIYCSNPEIHPVISFPDGHIRSLPNELRLLHWENYPLQFLPVNFDPMHLVEINMPYSQLCKLWDGTKNLEMLRTIRLCHSQQLVDIDNLLKAPNLEVIDLQGCTTLQSFPATGQLLHLRIVNLSGCTEIKSFPEIPPNIETLHLQGTGIRELPLSIVKPNYRELLNLLAEIPGLSGVSNLEQSDLKPLTSLMKIGTSDKNLGKLIRLELNDCSRLRSLPDMDNLELIKVLDLSGCSELETIQGFPRNLKKLYLAGTAVRQVPQLPQNLELFNAHGCVSLKSIRLNFEKLPVHYTFSNCFDLSPQVVSDFLVKALANAQHITREHQELNEAPAFSLCVPSHENQNSTLDLQPGSSVMTRLNSSWKNTLVGFAMLVEVAFSEDYYDATGFGIRCVCRWKNKEGHSHSIERNLHCWAPGKAVPKVQKDHMFVLCDVNMRPSTDEGNGPDILADLIVFEFFPVNKQTKPLPDSCIVKRCGVRVITGNTSRYDVSPVLSLDPMEVSGNENEEVLRISYDGLQEMGKDLFLYIAGLFNDEDVGLVAPHIAKIIDMDVSNGLKVLADRSLIRVSSNGEIVMSFFLRQMGQEILHTESKKIERLGDDSMANTMKTEYTRYIDVYSSFHSMSPEEEEIFNKLSSPNTIDHEQGLIQLRKTTRSDASSRISLCTERILSLLRSLIISRYNIVQTNAAASIVNLSLEKPNKLKIVRSGFVPLLIDVLKSGSTEAQEHVIGALFSLAIEDENKMAIGILGAVEPLLHALRSSESERARQEAALALYHLSLIPNNRTRLVKAGAVPMMLSMIRSGESASRILLLLCNLAACLEGNRAMLDGNAVAILAAKLRECGGVKSEAAARENCVEALLTLSAGNTRFRGLASEAGLEEVLTEIVESESGSGRLKEKAANILQSMRGGDREFGEGAEAREWNRKLEASELSRSQFQGGQKGGFAYSSHPDSPKTKKKPK